MLKGLQKTGQLQIALLLALVLWRITETSGLRCRYLQQRKMKKVV